MKITKFKSVPKSLYPSFLELKKQVYPYPIVSVLDLNNSQDDGIYLLHDETKVFGYMAVQTFSQEENLVLLTICPNRRKQGYAHRLMECLPPKNYQYCFDEQNIDHDVVSKHNLQCVEREYVMACEDEPMVDCNHRFQQVTCQNIETYCQLLKKMEFCEEEYQKFTDMVIHNPYRKGYILYDEQKPVGIFHICCIDDVLIHGIELLEMYRGKGLGKKLITTAKSVAFQHGKIVHLEAACDNTRALHIYQQLNFKIVGCNGIYEII